MSYLWQSSLKITFYGQREGQKFTQNAVVHSKSAMDGDCTQHTLDDAKEYYYDPVGQP